MGSGAIIVLAAILAVPFGRAFTMVPLLRAGMALAAVQGAMRAPLDLPLVRGRAVVHARHGPGRGAAAT